MLIDLPTNQETILKGLKQINFDIEGSQTTILRAQGTIANARAILVANEAKLEESVKKHEELISRSVEEVRQQLSQQLVINDNDLRCRALQSVYETHRRVMDKAENLSEL